MAKPRHYVNNKDFLQCIIDYRAKLKDAQERRLNRMPDMPRYAGVCIDQICTNMGKRYNFCGYSYRADMVQDAILNCIAVFDNFNPEKSNNPFGYFSRIAWRAMLRTIWEERKQSYVKHKNFQRLGLTDEQYEGHGDYTDSHAGLGDPRSGEDSGGFSISDDVVARFEESLAKKRRAAKGEPDPEPEPEVVKDANEQEMIDDLRRLGFDIGTPPDDYEENEDD
jgi:DNA-directed RNA polymerase specialized sigma24 family protein